MAVLLPSNRDEEDDSGIAVSNGGCHGNKKVHSGVVVSQCLESSDAKIPAPKDLWWCGASRSNAGYHLKQTDPKHTYMSGTHLKHTYMSGTHLKHTYMSGTHLKHTYINGTHLKHTYTKKDLTEGAEEEEEEVFEKEAWKEGDTVMAVPRPGWGSWNGGLEWNGRVVKKGEIVRDGGR